MLNSFEKLFTPAKIGKMGVKNRIVMSPMGTSLSLPDGRVSREQIDYYSERARGGTGLIIFEATFLTKELSAGVKESYVEADYVIPSLADLCDAVQMYGAKICAQLSCGFGRVASNVGDVHPISSSANPAYADPSLLCHELRKDEIHDILDLFYKSSVRLKLAGFDAIEIHGHAGYLIDQFMSPVWNRRNDEYGGSPENRARFACEIVESIRRAVGADFPIIFRLALDHRFEGGRTLEESLEIIKILENVGVDALDIDIGAYESIEYIFPPSYMGDACTQYIAEKARSAVSIPLINAGNHTPDTALAAVESGMLDFVSFGRPLLADPFLAKKMLNGKSEEVRPCIRCNEECLGRSLTHRSLSCSVNVQAAHERFYALNKKGDPKKVIVVGAGPAGLEAARVAAEMGHQVALFEANAYLGGQIAAAATSPFKSQLKNLISWYECQLVNLNVDIRLGSRVKINSPELFHADHIIVATGAVPITPPITGITGGNVIDVIDAHLNHDLVKGEKIIIAGGGLSGCDVALELAMEGKKVTIIEMLDTMAQGSLFINAIILFKMLGQYGVRQLTGHKIKAITDNGVVCEAADGREIHVEGSTIVKAFGTRSDNVLANEIREKFYYKASIVGDCANIGKVGNAIRSGFNAAFILE